MVSIGFTTGSLYRSRIHQNFPKMIKLFHGLGATAIELSWSASRPLLEFKLLPKMIKVIQKYNYVSIHAPWQDLRYNSDIKAKLVVEKLRDLNEQLLVGGIVIHPSIVDDFSSLEASNLPFLIENLGRKKTNQRKKFGIHPEHFAQLKKDYGFGFIFDAQHAYEHDANMNLAKELIDVMGDRLKHMHISGRSKSEIHFPTYIADNKDAIVKILELGICVPKILEGVLLQNIPQTAAKELAFIRGYEK